MIFEHLLYSAAIAVIAGMLFFRVVHQKEYPYAWIIVVSAISPDIDVATWHVLRYFGIRIPIFSTPIFHPLFHSIGALLVYSLLIGLFLLPFGFRFRYSALFAGLGFCSHLLEDALVYANGYPLLWPFSEVYLGIGIFEPYSPVLLRIADPVVLLVGSILLVLAIALRYAVDGPGWITKEIMPLHDKVREVSSL